ncbi:hypothetical protein [Amphibiibacter pelophylacis]|uniref:Uncharacterized protein n=1 Tax=Amphibiibacter pelophylacis TaxID=1799477 RepID=A0ACC6P0E6_9BURK
MALFGGFTSKLMAPLRRIGYRVLFAVGAATVVLFLAMAFLATTQGMAVLLAGLGAFVGALILSLVLPKMLVSGESSRAAQREAELKADLDVALRQRGDLIAEVERVKAQQLQFQQVRSVLRLTLLEVDSTLTDFKREDMGEREKTLSSLSGKDHLEYVGVLRRKVKVLLGIDLERLRVRADGPLLTIDGLHAEFQGVKSNEEDWLLRQMQVSGNTLLRGERTKLETEGSALSEAGERQRKDLEERLRSGVEFAAFDLALEKLGEQWLRAMLAPMGYQVQIGRLEEAGSQPFMQLLQEREQALHQHLGELRAGLLEHSPKDAPDSDPA